jgi:hypothetical protein
LRAALKARSIGRADKPVASDWFVKQFHRWLVAEFNYTQPMIDLEDYEAIVGTAAPDWLRDKFNAGSPQPLELIDPDHPHLVEAEIRCAEWLGSKADTLWEQKFPRMTPPQILAHWRRDHQRIARHAAKGIQRTSGGALMHVMEAEGYRVVEFDPTHPEFRQELRNESGMMGHCLGQFADTHALDGGYGEGYASAAEACQMRLFSVRNSSGKAHVTIATVDQGDDTWVVDQIKGRQNVAPHPKYIAPVKALLKELTLKAVPHPDCSGVGLYAVDGRYVEIDEVKDQDVMLQALAANPSLITRVQNPSVAVKWLMALYAPAQIVNINDPDPLMQIAAHRLSPSVSDTIERLQAANKNSILACSSGLIDDVSFSLREWANTGHQMTTSKRL